MMLFDKDLAQIAEETLTDLEAAGIDGSTPGDITRILLGVVNKQLDSFYQVLRENHVQAFVSKATESRLELIGQLVQCKRVVGESDDNYRYRICNAVLDAATANETAVRLAALSAEGVQDVMMRPFTHGTGSFSVYVVSEESFTPEEILESVRTKLEAVKGYGIRTEVYRPVVKEVQVSVRVVYDKTVSESERALGLSLITEEIQFFLNGLNVGQILDFGQFEKIARSTVESVKEVHIFNFKIDGRPVFSKDIIPAWNERFVEASVPNAVYVI